MIMQCNYYNGQSSVMSYHHWFDNPTFPIQNPESLITEYSILFVLNGVCTLVVHHGPTREVFSVFITEKAHWLSKLKKKQSRCAFVTPIIIIMGATKKGLFLLAWSDTCNELILSFKNRIWVCRPWHLTTPPKLSFSPLPHPPLGAPPPYSSLYPTCSISI